VWDLGSSEAAEFTKLAETTYRDVNIALSNEFARFASAAHLNVYEVIEAANSQPFSHIHRPGISVGGHCIPVYPRLYLAGDPGAQLPALARDVNEAVPGAMVRALAELAGGLAGQRVVILGAAYRGGVKETAFSGVFPLAGELSRLGATPLVHDPLYTAGELRDLDLEPYCLGETCDAAILHTDHAAYVTLTPADLPGVRALLDGRAITEPHLWAAVPRAVLGIGQASPGQDPGPGWASGRAGTPITTAPLG
ncbi:MAG: UDP binding domain-containing protein, partial [Pseudolabrys sp.]